MPPLRKMAGEAGAAADLLEEPKPINSEVLAEMKATGWVAEEPPRRPRKKYTPRPPRANIYRPIKAA